MKKTALLFTLINLGIVSKSDAALPQLPLYLSHSSSIFFRPHASELKLTFRSLELFVEKRLHLELTITTLIALSNEPVKTLLRGERLHVEDVTPVESRRLEVEIEEEPPEELARLGLVGHGHCVQTILHGKTFDVALALRERHALDKSSRLESDPAHKSHPRPEEEFFLHGRVHF